MINNTFFPLIDVSLWALDDEYGIYPFGARDKSLLISPENKQTYIINNHRYLFKESFSRYPHQFWCEVIAYHIGCLLGVNVPKAIPAIRKVNGKTVYGALIEWFLSYSVNEGQKQTLWHGGEWMKAIRPDYDTAKGKQHNLENVLTICKILTRNYYEYWLKTLFFDSVIGNTDRHHDNWGFIFDSSESVPPKKYKCKLSPVFDNGTSLGHEILENNFYKFNDNSYLIRYITRGQHHMKISKKSDFSRLRGETHLEMIRYLWNNFKSYRKIMLNMILNDTSFIELEMLLTYYTELKQICPPFSLTIARTEFTLKLLRKRNELLKEILEQ